MKDSSLSPGEIERALTILAKLKATREAKPNDFYRKDAQIVEAMKSKWPDFTSRSLQEMVHWLAANKYAIGSSTDGYFYCLTPEDFAKSIRWSEGRISRISERVRAQKEAMEDLRKRSDGLFESEGMRKLTQEFQTVIAEK